MSTYPLIPDILPWTQLVATGGQTVYNTTWTADVASDVVVYSRPTNTAPNDVTQILTSNQYNVAFIGAGNIVQVTLVTPSTLSDVVTITRATPANRLNLYTNTNFTPSMLNADTQVLTLVDQQNQLPWNQFVPRYNISESPSPIIDTILPLLAANQFWAKNPSNTGFIALDVADIVSGGTVTQIDTGLGLTGGPITDAGTVSFATMDANTVWGNVTDSSALPTMVPTSTFLISADNLSDVPVKATARTNLGLAIGTDVQAYNAKLQSLSGLGGVANTIPFFSALNTFSEMSAAASSVLVTDGSSVPSLSQTLPLAVQANITKLGAQVLALNMNTHLINGVVDPVSAQDAATKNYVDISTIGVFLPLGGGTMSGIINMNSHKVINVTDPSSGQDAVTLAYLNSGSALGAYLPLSGGTMSGVVNMNVHKITNVSDPTNPQDAATKSYVDITAAGLNIQPAVYAASTVALTVTYANGASGIGATLTNADTQATFALDGTNPAVNSRVLIWNQASALQNGIYIVTNVGSGASNWILTRATDFDQPAEIIPGDLVIVNNGTLYAGTSFIQTATVTAVGTDDINFSQFTFSATAVLLKANNLSDVASTTSAFNNISPMTTKGDLIAYSTQNIRLAAGSTNGQILQVLSSAATGLAYSTAAYPVTASTSGNVITSDGTNFVSSAPAASATSVVVDDSATNATMYPLWVTAASGSLPVKTSSTKLSFNPSTSTLTATNFAGNATTSTTATNATNVATTAISTNSNFYPTFVASSLGANQGINTDSGLSYNPSTHALTATTFIGALSGNATTSTTATSATTATTATTATNTTVTDDHATNATMYLTWVTATSGNLPQKLSSTNLTFNPSTGTLNTSALTLSGLISGSTGIVSNTGLALLGFNYTASAVNYISLINNTTGSNPAIVASGSDTNITLQISGKGTGGVYLSGTSTNDAAVTGQVGEYISSVITSGSTVSLTTSVAKTITSISLTAGDWDVSGEIWFNAGGTTITTQVDGSIGVTNNALDVTPSNSTSTFQMYPSSTAGNSPICPLRTCRMSFASTTTVYMIGFAVFSVSTNGAYGILRARRVR